ncbi:MAG: hypothetical protein OXI34_08655 [Chloroflexota bacterium]|nr:hypothetical protein [Chloroflexota bacterium]MDE2856114.1 hypothetical protein [Chloroflexota bacterium]MDE2945980.1 hypothetical protein [Chloroflexota bacterium]
MSEKTQDQIQDLKRSKHGIITVVGVIVCVLVALLAGRDLLFGLVMGTIYSSGLGIGRRVSLQISSNAPADNIMPAKIIGPIAAAVVVGIITALILSAIQGAVDVSPAEGDDIIASIVKSFFDSAAALAVAAGVIVGGLASVVTRD